MIKPKSIHILVSTIACALASQIIYAASPYNITIESENNVICFGDPMALKLVVSQNAQPISQHIEKIPQVLNVDGLVLQVKNRDTDSVHLSHLSDTRFLKKGSEGFSYFTYVVAWCDIGREGNNLSKKLIFGGSGNYTISFLREGEGISNALDIQVKSSNSGKDGMSLLTGEDYEYVIGGVHSSMERMLRLQDVIEKCKGTVLSQIIAARLGLEYFEQFHEKHPSFQNFKVEYQQGKIKETLLKDARKYLALGVQLPIGFPIREQVLYQLTRIEVIENNYTQAYSLLDDLGKNYPKGKYGKRAVSGKEEIEQEQQRQRELAISPITMKRTTGRHLVFWIIGSVVVIAAACFIVWMKRKRSTEA